MAGVRNDAQQWASTMIQVNHNSYLRVIVSPVLRLTIKHIPDIFKIKIKIKIK